MNKASRIRELKQLQMRADQLRSELEFSQPGLIWYADSFQGIIVVEADGLGGASTSIVEGNYPFDYCEKYGNFFRKEKDAEKIAMAIARGEVFPSKVLDIPP